MPPPRALPLGLGRAKQSASFRASTGRPSRPASIGASASPSMQGILATLPRPVAGSTTPGSEIATPAARPAARNPPAPPRTPQGPAAGSPPLPTGSAPPRPTGPRASGCPDVERKDHGAPLRRPVEPKGRAMSKCGPRRRQGPACGCRGRRARPLPGRGVPSRGARSLQTARDSPCACRRIRRPGWKERGPGLDAASGVGLPSSALPRTTQSPRAASMACRSSRQRSR